MSPKIDDVNFLRAESAAFASPGPGLVKILPRRALILILNVNYKMIRLEIKVMRRQVRAAQGRAGYQDSFTHN